jgi:general secretion pathway protein C
MTKQKDGTMKQIINSRYLSTITFILSIIVFIKLLWMAASIFLLPKSGEEYKEAGKAKTLYYRVRLTNESNVIAPVKNVVQPVKVAAISMRNYKLLGLYNDTKKLVVTVEKGRKTTILAKGEKIDGFELSSSGDNFAIFKKNGQEFKLSLLNVKNTRQPTEQAMSSQTNAPSVQSTSHQIIEQGGTKVISRSLLTSYTTDIDKIWKDIGIAQYKQNGKLSGFKVNYVKKGSDFEKLGLMRGDILKAINAEELNSLSSAMNFFKDINNIENLTLTVERNGKREDMEYEIQ